MTKMKKALSTKEKWAQKVLVRTINEFLRRGYFSLKPDDNKWPEPAIEFSMAGVPAIASVRDISHSELAFHVALWPTPRGKKNISLGAGGSPERRSMGGFFTVGWLERKKGAWLQTSEGFLVYCSRARQDEVAAIPWENPIGYSAEGRFYL